jgi:TonB-linked SusC/RagA family outer membrane protein
MKKILLLSFALMLVLFQQVMAQSRTISGRVTDKQSGEGLPGVTILLKGTTTGVSTSSDGNYSLPIPADEGILVVSFIGYGTVEQPIGSNAVINVTLSATSTSLNEAVVVGFGTQDVKDITGSIAEVKSTQIATQPLPSFDQALTGRVAGLQVTNPGGALGDGVVMRIRGVNTISGNSQPLVVIDGVPTSQSTNVNQFNGGNGTRYNPLADINPNDIESVTVLKDASASAIYGSRAANGVLIITTKRGRAGQAKVGVESWIGFNQPVKLLKMLNGDQFNTIQNEKATNRFGTPTVIAADIDVDGDGKPDRTDWLKEVFHTGVSQNYTANVSGGSDKASFYGSVAYTDQNGILLANRLRRGSVRANVDLTPKTWLRAGISANVSKTLNNGVLTDAYLAGATVAGFNAPPNVPVYQANGPGGYYLGTDGLLGNGGNNVTYRANSFYNPVATARLQRNDNTSQRILGNAYLEVEPIKSLKIRTQYGIDYLSNFEDQYSSPLLAGLGRLVTSNGVEQGLVQDNLLTRNIWNWTNSIGYDHTFGENHTLSASAGFEYYNTSDFQIFTGAGNFADTKFTQIFDGLYSGTSYTGGTASASGFQSYFGRLNYSFANKYYAQAALRSDASSVFGADNRRGYFPAGSVGWRISEEEFIKRLNTSNNLNDLKLRGSYGIVGNSAGIGSYASQTLVQGGQYAEQNGYSTSQVGNAALQWERSKKWDAGLDLSMFDNRVGLTVDYFRTNVDGLLLQAPVLRTTGIPLSYINRNIGAMYNQGIEITLNTVNVKTANGFVWTSSFNLTNLKNRVTALVDGSDIGTTQRASVGHALSEYNIVRWAGVDAANGRAKYLSLDGTEKEYDYPTKKWYLASNGTTETTAITSSDAVFTGKTGYPTLYGGFDNTFSFKGFELGVFMQYSAGNYIYNYTRSGLMTNSLNNNLTEILDRWTTPGQETNVPKLYLQDAVSVSSFASTRWLEKGNFLRARQLSLAYNLPASILKKGGLGNVRIYAQVLNAFVITSYKGSDPEVNSNRNNSNITYGVDNRSVPQQRSYTLGVNISL